MARFIIQAMAASFIHCEGGPSGSYDMVSVAFGAPALARVVVEVKKVDDLKLFFDEVKSELLQAGKPYSLSARLVAGDRAPSGWNARKFEFRHDESFGVYQ